MTILIVEDEKKLSEILQKALKGERYSVDVAYDGNIGLDKALKNKYSLILLDLMLPKKDGITVCKELREHQVHTPIIMLTAKGSVEDRVEGLDVGADDYLIKPFSLDELYARVRAVLRRRKKTDADIIKIGHIIMDKKKHEVVCNGKRVSLTPKEYKLLDVLVSNPGEAISRQRLIDVVWGPEFIESNNELNVHLRYLRSKIDTHKGTSLIRTIRGVGFILKE